MNIKYSLSIQTYYRSWPFLFTIRLNMSFYFQWICKTLTAMFNFAHATNFYWMFVEGLYLHIIIVWTYSADKIKLRYLVFIGWGKLTIRHVLLNDFLYIKFYFETNLLVTEAYTGFRRVRFSEYNVS